MSTTIQRSKVRDVITSSIIYGTRAIAQMGFFSASVSAGLLSFSVVAKTFQSNFI
jgi:hypothetical protein